MILHFTTINDVATQLSGHADRFATPEAYEAACRHIWRVHCEHGPTYATIDSEVADDLMDEAVEDSAPAPAIEGPLWARLLAAARALLARIDTMTTTDFERGGERAEREALRAVLAEFDDA